MKSKHRSKIATDLFAPYMNNALRPLQPLLNNLQRYIASGKGTPANLLRVLPKRSRGSISRLLGCLHHVLALPSRFGDADRRILELMLRVRAYRFIGQWICRLIESGAPAEEYFLGVLHRLREFGHVDRDVLMVYCCSDPDDGSIMVNDGAITEWGWLFTRFPIVVKTRILKHDKSRCEYEPILRQWWDVEQTNASADFVALLCDKSISNDVRFVIGRMLYDSRPHHVHEQLQPIVIKLLAEYCSWTTDDYRWMFATYPQLAARFHKSWKRSKCQFDRKLSGLVQADPAAASDILRDIASSKDIDCQLSAIGHLVRLGRPDTMRTIEQQLKLLLTRPNNRKLPQTLRLVLEYGPAAFQQELASLLSNKSSVVRRFAATAIAAIHQLR